MKYERTSERQLTGLKPSTAGFQDCRFADVILRPVVVAHRILQLDFVAQTACARPPTVTNRLVGSTNRSSISLSVVNAIDLHGSRRRRTGRQTDSWPAPSGQTYQRPPTTLRDGDRTRRGRYGSSAVTHDGWGCVGSGCGRAIVGRQSRLSVSASSRCGRDAVVMAASTGPSLKPGTQWAWFYANSGIVLYGRMEASRWMINILREGIVGS